MAGHNASDVLAQAEPSKDRRDDAAQGHERCLALQRFQSSHLQRPHASQRHVKLCPALQLSHCRGCANVLRSQGKKYPPKVFSALKTQVPRQAKKRFGVYQKACFQGKQKENTYTPKGLQGVCGGPLRAALVYRFSPPIRGTGWHKIITSKNAIR